MSLDDLEQALFEAKWGDAEEDVTEVIARVLELSREAVERVLYAATIVRNSHVETGAIERMDEGLRLSPELRAAISEHVQDGVSRAVVRRAIQDETAMSVSPAKLIRDPAEICSGCTISIACIAKNYSSPAECFEKGPPVGAHQREDGSYQLARLSRGKACVTPVKISKNTVTVTCTHPRGTYKVQAKDLTL